MYRVTTPVHTFTLPIDTSELAEIQVTYRQGNKVLVKHYQDNTIPNGMTLNEDHVIVMLTQQETKNFSKGAVSIQLRALTLSGRAYASQIFKITANDTLNEEILA